MLKHSENTPTLHMMDGCFLNENTSQDCCEMTPLPQKKLREESFQSLFLTAHLSSFYTIFLRWRKEKGNIHVATLLSLTPNHMCVREYHIFSSLTHIKFSSRMNASARVTLKDASHNNQGETSGSDLGVRARAIAMKNASAIPETVTMRQATVTTEKGSQC